MPYIYDDTGGFLTNQNVLIYISIHNSDETLCKNANIVTKLS